MTRNSMARRYAPLAALAIVQLLIILLVPSKANVQTVNADGTTGSGGGDVAAGAVNEDGTPVDGTTDSTAVAGVDGAGATAGGAAGGAPGAATAGGAAGGATGGAKTGATGGGAAGAAPGTVTGATGSTAHCVAGRQFDPALDPAAPACVPKFTGNNGGATYKGVTADKIKIIHYIGKGSDAVDTILKAQNAYASPEQIKDYLGTVQKFYNERYEFYGRKLEIKVFQGTCETIPPAVPCLKNEVRQIISSESPYAIVWNTAVASAFFAEAAANKVVVAGGWHFSQKFSSTWRPYYYDAQISGSQIALNAADLVCKQLVGFKARYAGDATLQQQVRKFGLISPDDTENKAAGVEFENALKTGCGATISARYFYAQDIGTAGQQTAAYISEMRSNGVTTEVCLTCDLVAPQIGQEAENAQRYYPERVVTGNGYSDSDGAGQSYNDNTFKDAFGFSQLGTALPITDNTAAKQWRATGRTGAPYAAAEQTLGYYQMLGSLIQGAGPTLTPANMYAAGQKTAGLKGDFATRSFDGGRSTWFSDVRRVYWDPNKTSTFNGKPGTLVNMDGRRYRPGEFAKGEFTKPKF